MRGSSCQYIICLSYYIWWGLICIRSKVLEASLSTLLFPGMASSFAAAGFCNFCPCSKQKRKPNMFPLVKSSQSFRDEGNSADIVDANLSILRKRMEELKKKEMLMINKSCRISHGWNYKSGYDDKHKRADIFYASMEMIGFVGGAVAFVFLSGSLCIFLISLLVNLSN